MAQFTKQAIIQTFIDLLNEQPFDKITVTDIVTKCGVNRNTFYYYFQDIYALVDELFRNETNQILDSDMDFAEWQDGFLKATMFARQNMKAIYHLYNSINRDRLETYLYDVTSKSVSSFLQNQAKGMSVPADDIRDLTVLYTVALEGIVLEWLHEGMQQSPEDFIATMARLLDGSTTFILKRAAETANAR